MKFSTKPNAFALIAGVFITSSAAGQSSVAPGVSESNVQIGDFRFFVAQRFWFASWDTLLLDAKVVVPDPANPVPVIQQGFSSSAESIILPVTSLGVGFGSWSLATNLTPTTDVSISEAAQGEISRSEWDINLSYAINENLSAALIYKSGKVKNAVTTSAANLLGVSSIEQDLSAWLIGISGRGKVAENFTMYGNAAFGPGRLKNKSAAGDSRQDFLYSIGEIGVSYQFPNTSFGSWSIQLGYRIQSILVKDVEFQTYSLPQTTPPTVISSDSKNMQTTTQGIILGLTLAF